MSVQTKQHPECAEILSALKRLIEVSDRLVEANADDADLMLDYSEAREAAERVAAV